MESDTQREILNYMARTSVNAVVGGLLVVGLVVWLLYDKVDSTWLFWWCIAVSFVNSARLVWSIRILSNDQINITQHSTAINAIICGHALGWAALGFALYPTSYIEQSLLGIILMGVAAISMQTVIFSRGLIMVMVVCATGGITIRLLQTGAQEQLILALFLSIFALVVIVTSFRLRNTFRDLITHKLKNQTVAKDLSEVTGKLESSMENLQQEYLAKTAFVAELHHELRTPINAISGFTQLLGLSPSVTEDEGAKAKLGHINRALNHVLSLVDRVLDVTSVSAGEMHLDLRNIDISAIIKEVTKILHLAAEERHVSFQYEDGPKHLNVHADALRVQQVLLNLISNAIKYNRIGGQVIIEAENKGDGFVQVSVTDTGIGLKAIDSETAFRAFGRINANHAVPGTGLGLFLSNKMIEHMGGTLDFTSKTGEGTRFFFTLPAGQEVPIQKNEPGNLEVFSSKIGPGASVG